MLIKKTEPAKKKYKKPEGDIQRAVTDYLAGLGMIVMRTNAGVWQTMSGHYIHGVPEGYADVHCCTPNGLFLAIETKAARGKLSVGQEKYRSTVEGHGGTYLICKSVDGLREQLVNAFGPARVAQWETDAAGRVDSKKAIRDALMRKMGQKK